MPELHQLQLLEAMHSSQSFQPQTQPVDDGHSHSSLTSDDIGSDMASCPSCHHSMAKVHASGDTATKVVNVGQGLSEDIAAFGRLVIQVYRGKMLHHAAADLK